MQLPAYDIRFTISDPNDPDTKISATLSSVPREKILTVPFPLKSTLEVFERSVVDEQPTQPPLKK